MGISAVQTGAGWDVDDVATYLPTLPRRPYMSQGLHTGRMIQQTTSAADHTSHIEFTFEAEPGVIEFGVLNNVAAPIVGCKAAFAFSTQTGVVADSGLLSTLNSGSWTSLTATQPVAIQFTAALSAATSGTLSAAWAGSTGSYLVTFSDGSVRSVSVTNASTAASWTGAVTASPYASAAVSSSTFSLLPAPTQNSIDNPSVTWIDQFSVAPPARTDGGERRVGQFRIEIPGASNATIPLGYWSNIGELENDGDASTAPYGRPVRGRAQATLGVTTKSNFTSTTSTGQVVPVIVRFTPRDGKVKGFTLVLFGNSLHEGVNSGATARRVGWHGRLQRDQSTPTRPITICNLAVHGSAISRSALRLQNLLAQINPEAFAYEVANINSAVVAGNAAQALADINVIRAWNNLARHALKSFDGVPIWLTSPPTNYSARNVVAYDSQRLAINAEYKALYTNREMVVDIATALSDGVDSNGQTKFVDAYTSDGLHESDAGAEVEAALIGGKLSRLYK